MLFLNEQRFVDGQKISDKTLIQQNDEIPHIMIKPHLPQEFWEMVHDISMFLVLDDKHDLGHFAYSNRNHHYYRGKKSPNHPQPFHHWQLGMIGIVVAQMGALISKALEIKSEMEPPKAFPTKFKKIIDVPFQEVKSLPLPPSNNNVYNKLSAALENI